MISLELNNIPYQNAAEALQQGSKIYRTFLFVKEVKMKQYNQCCLDEMYTQYTLSGDMIC